MDTPRTLRLLVVEDDAAYMYLVLKTFKGHSAQTDWQITVAKDGQEALDMLFMQENNALPDLILLDWNLPKVSGEEVLRRLKEHERLRKLPVFVFSSSDADKDILSAYDHHANGYITKPGAIEALAGMVDAIERFCSAVQLPKLERVPERHS
jgi:CheY-like chemotaxis protein